MKESKMFPEIKILSVSEGSPGVPFRSPSQIFKEFKYLNLELQEQFWVVNLNSQNQVINKRLVSIGTLNSSFCHPRDVYFSAIISNAASVLVVHNHPSGCADPSLQDLEVTQKLKEAGKILGIPLLDHVIVGKTKFFSFKENGQI